MTGHADGSLSADEAAALRAFALRLIGVSPDVSAKEPQFLVGRLPEDLPSEIPLPDDCHVVGSLVVDTQIRILFETALQQEAIGDFYRERLLNSGWQDLEEPRGGFARNGTGYGRFFFGEYGSSLVVFTSANSDALSAVQIHMNRDIRLSVSELRIRHTNPETVLPILFPPEGARQYPDGSSWSAGQRSAGAALYTEVTANHDVVALAAHYAAQLEQAYWNRVDAGQAGPIAWSRWTFLGDKGEEWEGLFFVFEQSRTQPKYALRLQAVWQAGRQPDQGGGTGFSMPLRG